VSEIELSAFDFETERLRLRPVDAKDEALYCELYTDQDTMRFIGPPLSIQQAINKFQKIVARQSVPSLKGRFLAMVDKGTLRPMGICGTSHYDADALRVEVGIVLRPEARGRGIAREALTALMRRIFAVAPIQEIYVRFSAQCQAVERLNIRMGFVPCADEVRGEGSLSKRVWSVHRSSWYVNEATN
jgi:RimJ/RimL family protein N-acetyltransferase